MCLPEPLHGGPTEPPTKSSLALSDFISRPEKGCAPVLLVLFAQPHYKAYCPHLPLVTAQTKVLTLRT